MDKSGQDKSPSPEKKMPEKKIPEEMAAEEKKDGERPGQGKSGESRFRKSRVLKVGGVAFAVLTAVPLCVTGVFLLAAGRGDVNISPLVHLATPIVVAGAPAGVSEGASSGGQTPRGRLLIGRAYLHWEGLHDGLTSPVLLTLKDVTIIDASGKTVDRIASGSVALDALHLLHGRISLTDIRISGSEIALRRNGQGDVDLDLPGSPSGKKGGFPEIDVRRLHRLSLARTHIVLTDDMTGKVWTVDPLDAELAPVRMRRHHGLTGDLTLGLTAMTHSGGVSGPEADDKTGGATGKAPVTLRLAASGVASADDTLRWHVAVDPLTPAALSDFVPALKAVRVPVGAVGDVTLTPEGDSWYMTPGGVRMSFDIGPGEVDAAGSTLYPASGSVTLHAMLGRKEASGWPAHLSVDTLSFQLRDPPATTQAPTTQAAPPQVPVSRAPAPPETGGVSETAIAPPTLTASGDLDWKDLLAPRMITGQVDLALTPVPFNRLSLYWPVRAAKGARRWVTRNITDGLVRNTSVHLRIGPDRTGASADIVGISGGLDGRGMELHWLRPITPIHGLDAHLDFTSLSTFNIAFEHGWQPTTRTLASVGVTGHGRLDIAPGTVVISDLDKKDQIGTITVGLTGDLRDHLALLAEPRLRILSKHPLPFTQPQGDGDMRFTLALPLISKVTTDQMTLNGHARLTHVHLGSVAMHRDVDDGRIDMDVTMHGLTLKGGGLFSGIPADVTGSVLFDRAARGQPVDQITSLLHLTEDNVVAAGVPVASYVSGPGELKVSYAAIKDAPDRLALDLDLEKTAVHIPLWSKAAGRGATVHADLLLDGGDIVAATGLRARGPELNVTGTARFPAHQPPVLDIPDFRIGQSTGSAMLTMPQKPMQPVAVHVQARTLDLSPLVEETPGRPVTPDRKPTTLHVPQAASGRVKGPPERPWLIDLAADRLFYRHDRALGGVQAFISHNGVRVDRMHLSVQTPSVVRADIAPVAGGRNMTVDVGNFGQLLDHLTITGMLVGGRASFSGHFDDTKESAPFAGNLKLSPFTLRNAPGALLVARSLSVYGWLNAKDTSSFEVTRFEIPVTFSDGVMHIHDGRAGNGALGATLEGPVYLDQGRLDLSGTIVPIFALNEIPGKLPAIGKLFAPEKGGGLLAVKFRLDGRIDKPAFSVSPLTIFLPGMLRDMF